MGCNSYQTQITTPPAGTLTCASLALTPCSAEQEMIHNYLLEAFNHLPAVPYRVWNRNIGVDDRYGHVDNKWYMPQILLNSEFDFDRQIKEFQNGVWITTQKIEMSFLKVQMEKYNIIPKLGDIIYVVDRWVEVLSVNKAELIPGTSTNWLMWKVVVDTKQVTES